MAIDLFVIAYLSAALITISHDVNVKYWLKTKVDMQNQRMPCGLRWCIFFAYMLYLRRATCDMRHATCDMRHATCDMRHATCDMRHEMYITYKGTKKSFVGILCWVVDYVFFIKHGILVLRKKVVQRYYIFLANASGLTFFSNI
jgi:hypothetical protein